MAGEGRCEWHRIAVFASGEGTNAEALIRYFRDRGEGVGQVVVVVTNRRGAGVVVRARRLDVPVEFVRNAHLEEDIRDVLQRYGITFCVLAGFLRKIPASIVQWYRGRIVNLHPALLPRYGGKGMYGDRVFRAMVRHREPVGGITVHFVDEEYDHGPVIAQFSFPVEPEMDVSGLAVRTHEYEHRYFPVVVDMVLRVVLPVVPSVSAAEGL